jgi:hypothetical protein
MTHLSSHRHFSTFRMATVRGSSLTLTTLMSVLRKSLRTLACHVTPTEGHSTGVLVALATFMPVLVTALPCNSPVSLSEGHSTGVAAHHRHHHTSLTEVTTHPPNPHNPRLSEGHRTDVAVRPRHPHVSLSEGHSMKVVVYPRHPMSVLNGGPQYGGCCLPLPLPLPLQYGSGTHRPPTSYIPSCHRHSDLCVHNCCTPI